MHRGGVWSQSVSETGLVFGVGPCGPPRFAVVGGALGLGNFEKDDLYAALDGLAGRQARIEKTKTLYRQHYLSHRGPSAVAQRVPPFRFLCGV